MSDRPQTEPRVQNAPRFLNNDNPKLTASYNFITAPQSWTPSRIQWRDDKNAMYFCVGFTPGRRVSCGRCRPEPGLSRAPDRAARGATARYQKRSHREARRSSGAGRAHCRGGTSVKRAAGAEVINLGDRTLLPGLIDAHVHLFLHPGAEDLQTVQ